MANERLVIVNTTPLINFAELGRLELLQSLFGTITVPPSVVAELRAKQELFPAAAQSVAAPFVQVAAPTNLSLVATLTLTLHQGESECLALALEHAEPALLVLDDIAARDIARLHRLRFTGTVGCLRLAKDLGLVNKLAPLLDDLRTKARFWLNPQLIDTVLRDVGEVT